MTDFPEGTLFPAYEATLEIATSEAIAMIRKDLFLKFNPNVIVLRKNRSLWLYLKIGEGNRATILLGVEFRSENCQHRWDQALLRVL